MAPDHCIKSASKLNAFFVLGILFWSKQGKNKTFLLEQKNERV